LNVPSFQALNLTAVLSFLEKYREMEADWK